MHSSPENVGQKVGVALVHDVGLLVLDVFVVAHHLVVVGHVQDSIRIFGHELVQGEY